MSDVLERLSAANPLPDCPPPPIEQVWALLATQNAQATRSSGAPGRSRRAATRRLLLPVAVVAAAITLALLSITGGSGGGLSVVARAYAATSSNGTIVRYLMSSRMRPAKTNHVRWKYMEIRGQVWVSGSRRHVIETLSFVPGQASLSHEVAVDGNHVESFQSNTIIESTVQNGSGSCTALVSCSDGVPADPLAEIRRLYKARQLRSAGQTTLDHRRVDVIVSRDPGVRVLVDPRTFIPIQITQTFGSRPWPISPIVTTTITNYQRLPLTPSNSKLLNLRPHPRARIACTAPSGAITVTPRGSCDPGPVQRPATTSGYQHAIRQTTSGVDATVKRYAPGRWEITVKFTASNAVTGPRNNYTILVRLDHGERLLWTSNQDIQRNTRVTEVFRAPFFNFAAGVHTGTVHFNAVKPDFHIPNGPDEIPIGNFELLNSQAPTKLGMTGDLIGNFAVTIPGKT